MELTGKEIVCRFLEAEGVEYIFGNPGSTEVPLLDNLLAHPNIRYILALHESAAVAMADGYARSSGKPSVVSVHACPGTANAVGNLINAHADGVPLVVMAGQQDSRALIREPMLSGDLVPLVEQFTKWSYEVTRVEELSIALRRAFKEATSPPTGPVFLSLPRNVLDETTDVEIAAPESYRVAPGLRGDIDAIRRAAELLVEAEKPVIVAGVGVAQANAAKELVKLAEILAARVYADPSSFPTGHRLYFGTADMRDTATLVKDLDVLLVVGREMFVEFNYSAKPTLPPHAKAVHIDTNPWEIAKNYPVEAGIVADPKVAIRELIEQIQELLDSRRLEIIEERLGRIKEMKSRLNRDKEEEAASWSSRPLCMGPVISSLREVVKDDAIVVDQSIRSSTYLKKYFEFDKPGTYYTDGGGYLGWGLAAAIGVKLAQPERQVIALVGDGGAMYCPQAMWTAAQHNIPITVLLANNGGYAAVKAHTLAYGGEAMKQKTFIGADVTGIDYVKLAESLGVVGRRIERAEDIKSTLEWAVGLDQPALVEVIVDPKDAGFKLPRIP